MGKGKRFCFSAKEVILMELLHKDSTWLAAMIALSFLFVLAVSR